MRSKRDGNAFLEALHGHQSVPFCKGLYSGGKPELVLWTEDSDSRKESEVRLGSNGASPVLTKSSKAQQIPALICCRSCALSSGLPCPGAAPAGGPWGHSFSRRSACALLLCEAQQKQRSPFIGLTVPAQL